MKRCDSILLKVFLCGLPFIAVLVAVCHFYDPDGINHNPYLQGLNSVCGLFFSVWMALTIYLSVRLMASGSLRDQVLTKLTFMRERDEREAMMAGRATRTAFLTSLAVLVFLFFLSCFQVSVYRVPPELAVNGKTGFLTLGVGFDMVQHADPARAAEKPHEDLFSYTGLPLSTTAVILILIAWQVLSYNYTVRRLAK
jgi:hypothetical protein